MLLVDTSIWIHHFRYGVPGLGNELAAGRVFCHPWVWGELACGNLKERKVTLVYLMELPPVTLAEDPEVIHLIEGRKLWGRGIGWVDAHLLTSALLSRCRFWTLDKRLEHVAADLGLTPALNITAV